MNSPILSKEKGSIPPEQKWTNVICAYDFSDWADFSDVTTGIPEESFLGFFLFILLINDPPEMQSIISDSNLKKEKSISSYTAKQIFS